MFQNIVQFYVNAKPDHVAAWIVAYSEQTQITHDRVSYSIQKARSYNYAGKWRVGWEFLASYWDEDRGKSFVTALGWGPEPKYVISFDLLPVAAERTEITATCHLWLAEPYLLNLLTGACKVWPECQVGQSHLNEF